MTTRYLRSVMPANHESLVNGELELQVQCTGPNGTIPEGPHFYIAPQQVLKCSDDLATNTLAQMYCNAGEPLIFSEVVPDPDPPSVDVDLDPLIAAIVGG